MIPDLDFPTTGNDQYVKLTQKEFSRYIFSGILLELSGIIPLTVKELNTESL